MQYRRYNNKRARNVYHKLKDTNFIFKDTNDTEYIAIEMLNQDYLEYINTTGNDNVILKSIEIHNSSLSFPIPIKLDLGKNIETTILEDASFRNNDKIILANWYSHSLLHIKTIDGVSILACLLADIKELKDVVNFDLKKLNIRYLSFDAVNGSRSYLRVLALYVSIRDERMKISVLDEKTPKKLDVWDIHRNEIGAKLNPYSVSFEEAMMECLITHKNNISEDNEFIICAKNKE